MRHVRKGVEPRSLSIRRRELKRTPDLACDLYCHHLTPEVHQAILDRCIAEQQGLCAYTGWDLSGDKAHVEHLIPILVDARKEVIEVDMRYRESVERKKLLAKLEDSTTSQLPAFAFQRSQVLRREWAGAI